MPFSQNVIDGELDKSWFTTADAFRYIYGSVGSDYLSSSLSWANRNTSTKDAYTDNEVTTNFDTGDRRPNNSNWNAYGSNIQSWGKRANDFNDFYQRVGNKVYNYSHLKHDEGSGEEFGVVGQAFPVLAQMGLKLDQDYNYETSSYMLDNFCSSIKVGKRLYDYDSSNYSYYFLTPNSLGVSYVPLSVFKPAFTSILDATIRLNKLASGSKFNSVKALLDSANGCVSTNVYTTSTSEPHDCKHANYYSEPIHNNGFNTTSSSNLEFIVNDGDIEYDLNSVQCKIDYFLFDAFDSSSESNAEIATKIIGVDTGAKAAQTVMNYNDYLDDKGVNPYKDEMQPEQNNTRIIAKVSARVKLHAPYHSSILQWSCKRLNDEHPGHYSVKLWDTDNDNICVDDDGLWYQSEAYYGNIR